MKDVIRTKNLTVKFLKFTFNIFVNIFFPNFVHDPRIWLFIIIYYYHQETLHACMVFYGLIWTAMLS